MSTTIPQRRMSAAEVLKRGMVMIVGMFALGFGIALCVQADLGISPITTIAYTMHQIVPSISLGIFVFLQNTMFFVLTLVLLRRDFRLYQWLLLPFSLVFGLIVDLSEYLLRNLNPSAYGVRILLVLASCVVIGFGFSLIVTSGVSMDTNTAFVNAAVLRTGKPYHRLKLLTDVALVVLASCVGLIFLHRVAGVHEGTVISALLIGPIAGFFNRRFRWMERLFLPRGETGT
ncbi:MAG: DUF6198 family protein [Oscillospiraceae bacterium]|nr:DUF6198 family protein [Oscillospiraceae bacterium]